MKYYREKQVIGVSQKSFMRKEVIPVCQMPRQQVNWLAKEVITVHHQSLPSKPMPIRQLNRKRSHHSLPSAMPTSQLSEKVITVCSLGYLWPSMHSLLDIYQNHATFYTTNCVVKHERKYWSGRSITFYLTQISFHTGSSLASTHAGFAHFPINVYACGKWIPKQP